MSVKGTLFTTEAGCILLEDHETIVSSRKFEKPLEEFTAISKGEAGPELAAFVKEAVASGVAPISVESTMIGAFASWGLPVEQTEDSFLDKLRSDKTGLMIRAGLVSSEAEAREAVRKVALAAAEAKIREMSTSVDLQVIQSVQALDEVDKTVNGFASRLKEWYGLHFPELGAYTSETSTYAKIVLAGDRNSLTVDQLKEMGLAEDRAEKILSAAARSKGGAIRPEDLAVTKKLAEEVLRLDSLRVNLASHVESTMLKMAPNISSTAGATVGARLIAKSGSLARLAQMPASTIQILGAEKALFRAMKTGSRPPKHGILFQHPDVHSAVKWERGRVARVIAGKIAIAARIDAYRGGEESNLAEALKRRLQELKSKPRKEPPPKTEEPRRNRRENRRKRW
ncbi:MAG: ribonucleotide-diphosphate reductase subunit beta [Thaumarchaeota archaeon]|nr:ribonucleotide-diphosphate reductase subunit beta [Nitrososphaerota archaeon]